jgi:transposase InsO family protein
MAMVETHGDRFGVEPICRALGYRSASVVYARRGRPPSPRSVRDEEILAEIRRVRKGYAAVYGARRTWKELRRRGVDVARSTVERLMRSAGMVGVARGRRARTTTPDETAQRAADLVNRDFTATAPNRLWLADITYVSTWEGWLYVALVQDVFSRMIVGWQTADHLRTDLPLDALAMALFNRSVQYGQTVHHSDAGSQYTAIRYTEKLDTFGVLPSIGSTGDSYDNAMAEALNGTVKAELIHFFGPWKTRAQAETAIYEWISWYNNERLHSALGDVPPAEYEAAYHAALAAAGGAQ